MKGSVIFMFDRHGFQQILSEFIELEHLVNRFCGSVGYILNIITKAMHIFVHLGGLHSLFWVEYLTKTTQFCKISKRKFCCILYYQLHACG